MTRLPPDRWTSLTLACGLMFVCGCGQWASEAAFESTTGRVSATARPLEQRSAEAPQFFTAAPHLQPLPVPPKSVHASTDNSAQAQFAQAEGQTAATTGGGSIYGPLPIDSQTTQPPVVGPFPNTGAPQAQPANPPTAHAAGSQRVTDQVDQLNQRALEMAQKGMLFAAKNELIQALQLFAQSLDVRHGGSAHLTALSAGLAALREAEDFSPEAGRDPAGIRVSQIASGHRTTLLHSAGDLPPVVAQQQYFAFAQQQLAISVAGDPAASRSLFTLGKIQLALKGGAGPTSSLAGPRAMALYQAALAADPRNHLAANELGVLLARYGQLEEARQVLLHSISIQPQIETWHNLSVVHQRLGETELARLAENERRLLADRRSPAAHPVEKNITWVDPGTFAASAAKEPGWQPSTAAQPTSNTRR